MDGWIKLHRKAFNNSLYTEYRPHTRREAWEDILVYVNYEDSFCLIGNDKIECKIGQSLMSLDSWAKIFNWSKSSVNRFFDMLKKENMIATENLYKTTRITVCNYADYQGSRNASETQKKRKRNTIKEVIDKSITKEGETWRNNYQVYKNSCSETFKQLSTDPDLRSKIESLYPKMDFEKSLAKSFLGYWITEDGWKNKKKSDSENINWKATIIKTIHFNMIQK